MAETDPFVVLTYGPSGIGKTTDMGYSFPRALFIAAPGALNSVRSVCGYKPDSIEVETIEDATKVVSTVGKAGRYQTVVIDDFSFLAEQTFAKLEKSFSGFRLWGNLRDQTLNFRNQSRYAGVNVVLNSWEQGPKTKQDGTRVRGGPQLSGKLPEQIPAMCDVVLRGVHDPRRQPWPTVYRCNNDPNWSMKDRFDTASVVDPAPMNLAEILRSSGRVIERHPDLPQQEAQVEAIAKLLAEEQEKGSQINAVANSAYAALVANGTPVTVARWTLRDALDRHAIRVAKAEAAQQFLPTTNTTFLG